MRWQYVTIGESEDTKTVGRKYIESVPEYTQYRDVYYCGQCLGIIDTRWKFCPWCGSNLNSVILHDLTQKHTAVNASAEDKEREKLVSKVVDEMREDGGLILSSESAGQFWIEGILRKSGMLAEDETLDDVVNKMP